MLKKFRYWAFAKTLAQPKPRHSPLVRDGALLYVLAVANVLLVFFDFTFRHGGASLPMRLVFALACAVLPFLVAFILAHLFAKSDRKPSTEKALSSFQVNLEIFWSLSLTVAVLTVALQIQQT